MKILLILSWTVLITVTNGKIPNKVIGGKPVMIVDYNHQVSVQFLNVHICGGSIIGKSYVLTSASCVSSEISHKFHATYAGISVLSGTSDLLQANDFELRMLNDVDYIIHHEEYNALEFFKHDIAILKLVKPFNFDYFRGKVSLSLRSQNQNQVYVTGWGKDSSGYITTYLQYLDAISLGPRKCKFFYRGDYNLYATQDCISPKSQMARITWGNGGSAVMKRHKIVGILSVISTDPNKPTIYTHAFQYYDWIINNIGAF